MKLCERLQPLTEMVPAEHVTLTGPHSLWAVILALQVGVAGLQPRAVVPPVQLSNTGAVATLQVTVREVLDDSVQLSVAVNVLVWERAHPLLLTAPSDEVTVGVLQLSVALAVPRAALISAALGLQPRVSVVPVAVIVGGVMS